VVFPVVHGAQGEDGCLQGLLEVLGLSYVGSDVRASALASDKVASKVFFERENLPLARDQTLTESDLVDVDWRELLESLRGKVAGDLVVKPAQGGSTIGIARIFDGATGEELREAVEGALRLDPLVLVERYFAGEELTCGVLERDGKAEALPVTRITSESSDWYDFEAKYAPGGSSHQCPADLPEELALRIQAAAVLAHSCLGARDLSRSDFLLAPTGEFVLLELNTLPGMTQTSLLPEAALAGGLSFPELADLLVKAAASRRDKRALTGRALPGR